MAQRWTWGVLSTNPLVDFSTTWVEPLIQRAVDLTHKIEPDLLFTLAYIAVLGVAYLFHSPFRAHSTAATDTYGRVTKVFQTWSTVVFFCFHLGPRFFSSKQHQIEQARSGNEAVPILYLPLFAVFTMLFAFLHKMKRRWGLGVTYGSRLSVIGLNALVLAAVGTVHYAYCSTLYENSSNWLLKTLVYSAAPAPVALHPFRCVAKLFFLSCCFVALDYRYKKWRGFDPSRGILWSELYELRKQPLDAAMAAEKNAKRERRDWRELVAPPRVYASTGLASAASPVRPAAEHGASHISPSSSFPALHGARHPTENASAVSVRMPGTPTAASATASPASSSPRPRMLYHESPPDVNMSEVEAWFDEDDALLKRVVNSTAPSVPPPPPAPTSSSSETETSSSSPCSSASPSTVAAPPDDGRDTRVRRVDHADRSLTRLMSFRAPRFVVQQVQEAQHPMNRPGMVPWWSTFVLFTAWQTVAGAMLHFLAFDVRTIQGLTAPKIFHLHFSASLKRCVASATECATGESQAPAPTMLHRAATSTPPGEDRSSTSVEEDGIHNKAAMRNNRSDPLGATSTVDEVNAAETAAPAEAAEEAPDVWFDWIADVGDGFNPTYAMARLLAQPILRLSVTSAKKSRRPRAAGGDSHASDDMRTDSASTQCTAKVSASAPTSPASKAMQKPTSLFFSAAASFPTKNVRTFQTTAGAEKGEGEGAAAGEGGGVEDTAPAAGTPLRSAGQTNSWDAARKASRDNDGESLRSRKAVFASYDNRTHQAHTAIISMHHRKTAASRAMLGVERDGVATLPRGSFVVVGGDLAYPSPNDETYMTRLFEPYSDALGGNVRLQSVFHVEQKRIVVADRHDVDVAHLHMLDAKTVADIASGRGGLAVGRGTAEEALRSVPLLFAIPGNHDWFDGLGTYMKYILEGTWIGGWLMPQRSSFFVLRLPYNWFMLCGDTGNTQDIDAAQRNYFLDVIEKYMNEESCVILAAHEPGWLFDAMEREDTPLQPQLNRVVEALGTRLRLRLAGDIHNYSRHVPTDPSSEAATLVVSGGGGAFMHGSRKDRVIAQGTRYVRVCAFPSQSTFTNMAARLWGFRVVNWKFDMVVGFLCFVILLSVLPLPVGMEVEGAPSRGNAVGPVSLAQVFSLWVAYATMITSHVIAKGVISIFPILFFWSCFSTAGSDRHATRQWRLCYGAAWTFAVLLCCSGAMAAIHVSILYLMDNGFLYSSEGRWNSVMEAQMQAIVSTFTTHARQILGGERHTLSRALGSLQDFIAKTVPMRWLLVVLRCSDPFETFSFLSSKVSSGTAGVFAADVSRLQVMIYYLYVLFFYWIVITPIVSMLIGTFLLISVTSFDYMYDGTYSAFQIEDYKHFLRFRLDAKTRQLHTYVIAVQKPAKVYELDRKFVWSLTEAGLQEHRPPHLKQYPSRWAPVQKRRRRGKPMTELLEHFTVHPHRVPHSS
ncbi:hypothetical protein ABB37_08657 [Leptomonas pyrrhocoris]|uniref:Calcineurin-like phosphoesterase domain-containing protein n=1 Tax=Leptomonas pyrrhocoris TaxID=157538 RepID=A0A0M9FT31_LEPPY|nr:hypothetical protein ABB37_08657 [Leptomonas pyrrhocoris]KPA75379.1 hypothetical protein ABB37_08657 [Leptomonas pyrrhocoris]|eukprot:XP_015653818.1 hypothetical protein ABB37_08657 [Leptomonas pyrrhocoris]